MEIIARRVIEELFVIHRNKTMYKLKKNATLTKLGTVMDIISISRIEGYPEEDKT